LVEAFAFDEGDEYTISKVTGKFGHVRGYVHGTFEGVIEAVCLKGYANARDILNQPNNQIVPIPRAAEFVFSRCGRAAISLAGRPNDARLPLRLKMTLSKRACPSHA